MYVYFLVIFSIHSYTCTGILTNTCVYINGYIHKGTKSISYLIMYRIHVLIYIYIYVYFNKFGSAQRISRMSQRSVLYQNAPNEIAMPSIALPRPNLPPDLIDGKHTTASLSRIQLGDQEPRRNSYIRLDML